MLSNSSRLNPQRIDLTGQLSAGFLALFFFPRGMTRRRSQSRGWGGGVCCLQRSGLEHPESQTYGWIHKIQNMSSPKKGKCPLDVPATPPRSCLTFRVSRGRTNRVAFGLTVPTRCQPLCTGSGLAIFQSCHSPSRPAINCNDRSKVSFSVEVHEYNVFDDAGPVRGMLSRNGAGAQALDCGQLELKYGRIWIVPLRPSPIK